MNLKGTSALPAFARDGRRVVALLALLHLIALITLSASPSLHELIHHDADSADHDCAVTVFVGGHLHFDFSGPLIIRLPEKQIAPSSIAEFQSEQLGSIFLGSCPLEHAPPRLG
jgi:hypothetical protein